MAGFAHARLIIAVIARHIYVPWQSHKQGMKRWMTNLWDSHVGTLSLLGMTCNPKREAFPFIPNS